MCAHCYFSFDKCLLQRTEEPLQEHGCSCFPEKGQQSVKTKQTNPPHPSEFTMNTCDDNLVACYRLQTLNIALFEKSSYFYMILQTHNFKAQLQKVILG